MYKVLIVDDNIAIREGLSILIDWSKLGFTPPTCAKNGEEALAWLESGEFDLLITDVRMPIMDGIALLREVTQRRIAVERVIISGYRDFEYAQAALEYRALRYILKPINEEQLTDTIKTIKADLDARCAQNENEPVSQEPFDQILRYIEGHLCERLSLKELAIQFHFNSAYLGRLFLKRKGVNFNEYLSERRARLAARLLVDRASSIGDIAALVGYADADHFSLVFKRVMGVTPSEYRANEQNRRPLKEHMV